MSAPDTNLDKQRKRHRGPIAGITFGLAFVTLLALAAFVWPGIPRDEQAAADRNPGQATEAEAVSTEAATPTDTNISMEDTQ